MDKIENEANNLKFEEIKRNKKRQGTPIYFNIETDINILKMELEEIQQVNIKNYNGRHIAFFKMQLEYMEECQKQYKKSDIIFNSGLVAVPITTEYEKITKEIITHIKRIINELELMEMEQKKERANRKHKKKN